MGSECFDKSQICTEIEQYTVESGVMHGQIKNYQAKRVNHKRGTFRGSSLRGRWWWMGSNFPYQAKDVQFVGGWVCVGGTSFTLCLLYHSDALALIL